MDGGGFLEKNIRLLNGGLDGVEISGGMLIAYGRSWI